MILSKDMQTTKIYNMFYYSKKNVIVSRLAVNNAPTKPFVLQNCYNAAILSRKRTAIRIAMAINGNTFLDLRKSSNFLNCRNITRNKTNTNNLTMQNQKENV